jgi:hypothetical protein
MQFGISKDKIDRVVTWVAMLFGVIDVVLLASNWFDEKARTSMVAWVFGDHWFSYWVYPITYLLVMQLLWIDAIRRNKIFRVVLALWILFFLHVELLVILITSLHRDYL